MQWFRLYDDLLDDPKVQQLSPALFKHWINLLCLANKGSDRGTLPSLKDIAFRLRLSEAKVSAILAELKLIGLLEEVDETLRPHNWDQRQRASDDVAKRVQKHRGNVTGNVTRNADVTVTRDRTDTDTEQNRERTDPPPTPPDGEVLKPKRAKPKLVGLPEDFTVTESMRSWAHAKHLSDSEIERRTEHFLNYVAKTGKQYADWTAAWRDSMGWESRPNSPNGNSPQRATRLGVPLDEFGRQNVSDEERKEFLRRTGWSTEQ